MAWQFSTDKPIFQQIVDIISTDIICGKYKPGEKLETVRDLAIQAGVNPNTMQRALTELENTGLVYTKRGSGRFINENSEFTKKVTDNVLKEKVHEFLQSMRSLGLTDEQIMAAVEAVIKEDGK